MVAIHIFADCYVRKNDSCMMQMETTIENISFAEMTNAYTKYECTHTKYSLYIITYILYIHFMYSLHTND